MGNKQEPCSRLMSILKKNCSKYIEFFTLQNSLKKRKNYMDQTQPYQKSREEVGN